MLEMPFYNSMFVEKDMHCVTKTLFYFITFADYITDSELRKILSMIMYEKYARNLRLS